jgi:hypothetical protein
MSYKYIAAPGQQLERGLVQRLADNTKHEQQGLRT